MEDVYKWVWFSKTLQMLLLQTKSTDSHLSDGWWMSNGCLRTFDALKAAYFHFPSCCPILPSIAKISQLRLKHLLGPSPTFISADCV